MVSLFHVRTGIGLGEKALKLIDQIISDSNGEGYRAEKLKEALFKEREEIFDAVVILRDHLAELNRQKATENNG